jgi:hypothetical protein
MGASPPKQTVYRKQEPERRSAWKGGENSFVQRIGFIIYVEARAALAEGGANSRQAGVSGRMSQRQR